MLNIHFHYIQSYFPKLFRIDIGAAVVFLSAALRVSQLERHFFHFCVKRKNF